MMHRRSLLGLIGLGTVAAVVPAAPALAKPESVPAFAPVKQTPLPLYRDPVQRTLYRAMAVGVEMVGGLRYTAAIESKYIEGGELIVWFRVLHTGTVKEITFLRGDAELFTMDGAAMHSPHMLAGSMVRVTVGSFSA